MSPQKDPHIEGAVSELKRKIFLDLSVGELEQAIKGDNQVTPPQEK